MNLHCSITRKMPGQRKLEWGKSREITAYFLGQEILEKKFETDCH